MKLFFPRKRSITSHPPLSFNNIPVAHANSQKHLEMQLDKKLNFDEHLNKVESKLNKTISITIYKSFFRPHLDYGDIIYDKVFNEYFHAKLDHFNKMPH